MKPLLVLLRRPLLYVAGLSFFVNLLMLVPALFMLQVFDRVLTSQSEDTLLMLTLGVAVALGLLLSLDYLRSRMQGLAGNVVGEALSPAIARITIAEGARRVGRAPQEGLRDISTLRSLFSSQGLIALFDAPWVIVYVAVIWLAHPLLGLGAAVAAVVMFALALFNDFITRRDIESLQKAAAGASRYLESSLQNAEVAQALGMTDAVLARWRAKNAEATALQRPTARKSVFMAALTRTVRQSIQVLMLGLGAWLVIKGEATAGVMIATTTLLGRALAPVEQVIGSWRVLAEGRAAYGRLGRMLDMADAQPLHMALPAPTGRLAAQGLVYRAPQGDQVILGGISFQLAAGEVLAVIGPSAAGKSTLMRILTGVWKPNAGVVRLDEADINQWPRAALGPHIGYVPQDVELFPGTVGENIARLGMVDAAKVVQAAQRAQVHEMILGLANGYDTMIDPGSAMLSPGQRQRIALARALYGEPKLLLLDEPNSNLDGAGEQALAACLAALRGKVTVIVVTHRSTLIQHVDKMLVLEGGRVQHYGPTAEVMRALQPPVAVAGPGANSGAPNSPANAASKVAPKVAPVTPQQMPTMPQRAQVVNMVEAAQRAAASNRGGTP